jgi:hypothetical protein
MKANGDYTVVDSVDVFNINLTFNISTFLVEIELTGTYQLDLNTQAFSDLIGFDVAIITSTQSGARLPDITNSIDSIYIHSSLCLDSLVSGERADVIFNYSTATLSRSFSYEFEPFNLLWHKMAGTNIESINMRTTDVNNREIEFNGIDVEYTLIIREAV